MPAPENLRALVWGASIMACACAGSPAVTPAPATVAAPVVVARVRTPWLEVGAMATPHSAAPREARAAIVPQRVHRGDGIVSHAYAVNGTRLLALDASGHLALHDEDGAVRSVHRLTASTSERGRIVAFASDGARAFVEAGSSQGDDGAYIVRLDTETVVALLPPEGSYHQSAASDAAVTRVATVTVAGQEATLRMFDEAGTPLCSAPLPRSGVQLVMGEGGASLFAFSRENGMTVFDTSTCAARLTLEPGLVRHAVRPGGGQLVTVESDALVARSPRDGRELGRRPITTEVAQIRYSPSGTCLAIYGEQKLTVVRAADGATMHGPVDMPRIPLRLDDDCAHVTIPTPRTPSVVDLRTNETTQLPEGTRITDEIAPPEFPSGSFHSIWAVTFDTAAGRVFLGSRPSGVMIDATGARRTCGSSTTIVRTPRGAMLARASAGYCDLRDGAMIAGHPLFANASGTTLLLGAMSENEEEPDAEPTRAFTYDTVTGRAGRTLATVGELPSPYEESGDAFLGSTDGRYVGWVAQGTALRVYDTRSGRQVLRMDSDDYMIAAFVGETNMLAYVKDEEVGVVPVGQRGRPRVLATGGGNPELSTGTFIRVAVEDGDTETATFVDVLTGARREVPGSRVRPLGAGRVVSERDADFEIVSLTDGATRRYDGRFITQARDGRTLVRCHEGVLRVHGISRPLASDDDGEIRGGCPPPRARLELRDDGKVLVERGLSEVVLTRLDDGTRIRLRVLTLDDDVVVYATDDDENVVVLAGDAGLLRRRAPGPAITAALGPVTNSDETRARLRRVLAP